MNEVRIEAALKSLGKNIPRTPEKTVDNMVKTVRALNAAKAKRAAQNAPAAQPAAEKAKEMTAEKQLKPPAAGMKR